MIVCKCIFIDFPPFSQVKDLKELIYADLIIKVEAINVLEQEVEGMSENWEKLDCISNLMEE